MTSSARNFFLVLVVTFFGVTLCINYDRGSPAIKKCRKDQVWKTCANDCDNFCPDPEMVCNKACKIGCFCPDGMMEIDKVCVLKELHCPQPEECAGGKVYTEFGNPCDELCPEIAMVCKAAPRPGCFCPEGMMPDENDECVPKEEYCTQSAECTGEKIYFECGSACANECPNSGMHCTKQCVPGCYCPPDKMEVNGECVTTKEYCKKYECMQDKVYKECGNVCDNLCPDDDRMCNTLCMPGWYCQEGMIPAINGTCVSIEEIC